MWMFYSVLVNTVFLPSIIYPLVTSYQDQPSNLNPYPVSRARVRRSSSDNVLWNKTPPTASAPQPLYIAFYSNEIIKLHCNVHGNPVPTYQWYVSTVDLAEKLIAMHNIVFTKVDQAINHTLILDGKMTKRPYSKKIYYCFAKNSLGSLHLDKVVVEKVTRRQSISIEYIFHPVIEGDKYVAKCHLLPEFLTLYNFKRWEVRLKSGQILYLNETVGRYSVISSTENPQLHIRNISNEDFSSTTFRCVFLRTIEDHDDIENNPFNPIEKFTFNTLVKLQVRCTGEQLTVDIGKNVEIPWCSVPKADIVHWFKFYDNSDLKNKIVVGNKANHSKFSMIGGNLFIANVTKADAGKYRAVGSNELEATFILKIYEKPSIYISPKDSRKKLSESAEFTCSLTVKKVAFRWLHNGLKVINGYDDGNVEITMNDNVSTLKVEKVRLSVSGVYQCFGSFVDDVKDVVDYRQISATLFLSEIPPTLLKQSPRVEKDSSASKIQMSSTNKVQSIECVFAANPRPKIDWFHDSKRIPIDESISVAVHEDPNSIYNVITKLTINFDSMNNNDEILRLSGEYHARATNSVNSTGCDTFVLMNGNLEIRLPTEQTAVSGKDHIMQCYFRAMEIPEFTWHRKIDDQKPWEKLPTNHRIHLIKKGHKLLIKNVIKSEDEGVYKCTIQYYGETREAMTKLSVVYPPILQHLPPTHDSSQSQTHICTIKSTADKPWYAWWTFTKNNSSETIVISPKESYTMFSVHYSKEVNEASNYLEVPDFVYKYPNVGVDLIVKPRPYDKKSFGTFVCHAKNAVGVDTKKIKDRFRKLEFGIIPPDLSYIVVGDDLYLDCTAKESDIQPTVNWKIIKEDSSYGSISLFSEETYRIFQYHNGTVVIRNIKEGDPTKLICFISSNENKMEEVQSKIAYIEIRIPARVQKLEKEYFKVSGSSFNLSCAVYGNNHNMSITWYYRSSPIASWGILHETCVSSTENHCRNQYQSNSGKFNPVNEIYNDTYSKVHLEFRDVSESVSGQYKCEAKNKYNKVLDQTNTTLIIITKPSIVITDSTVTNSNSTWISFDWRPPENKGNRPILHYIIRYSELSSSAYNGEQKNVTQRIIRVNDTVHAIVIDKLRPYHKYTVQIAAENEVGVGEAATIHVVTQEAEPQRSVNNLVASSSNHHEIIVSWAPPDPEYQNGRIKSYEICYQILPTLIDSRTAIPLHSLNWSNNANKNSNVKCESTEKRTIAISYLPQFTDFAIRVIAHNSKGASPPLFTKVRTLEDLPKAPPSQVMCEGRHQAIELTWNPPGRHTINGVLIGYAVYYYHPNQYLDESDMKSISVHGRTNVAIHQLKPYTRYSIQIMAVNRKGFGPPSASIHCTTKEAKPEAPETVKAWKINNTCIFISWLHTQNPNGVIREYCVVDVEIANQKCQPPDMKKRYNSMVFCNIHESFSSVKVFARNKYDGAPREVLKIDFMTPAAIISLGGIINVNEGSSIILPCERTTEVNRNVFWKKEDGKYITSDFQNLKILKNFSLEVTSVEKFGSHTYICTTESDSVEYNLSVQESNNGIPLSPQIDDSRVTESSVFIRWKSRGTRDMAAPIRHFIITWENKYSGDSKTVRLDGTARSFYLNNVTCASPFVINISSQNSKGNSKSSDVIKLRTIGSAPKIADSSMLLPTKNVESNSVNFNLLAFLPGDNCSITNFVVEISLSTDGSQDFTNTVFTKNISAHNLEDSCCLRASGLNPATIYKYQIMAHNPAGSTRSFSIMETLGVNGVQPTYRHTGTTNGTSNNHSWLLMIILVIVIAFILIIAVVAVLYALRSKEKKALIAVKTVATRQSDYKQNRIDKPVRAEDTISIDSEPSPYAVYQPDADPKIGKIWSQQVSQPSTTPLYNYTDHHYNQIRYDKIPGRIPLALDNYHDNYRRANSAECLSSLGNASVTGIADLESPSNIDRNVSQDYFQAPFNHCANTDEVFQNIRIQDFSTINRRRMRREDESQWRHNQENVRMIKSSGNQGPMNRSQYYEPSGSRIQRQIYPLSGSSHQRNYHQQMSVPEPMSIYQQQYGYPSNRLRSSTDNGRGHPSSQNMLTNNPGSSAQVIGYGSYYGARPNNMTSYATSSGVMSGNEPGNNQYSSYITGSNLSNYPPHRTTIARPTLQPLESPDEGIYTDRVVVV